jgi:histone-lysine N-methyltransferase SETD1
LKHKEEADKLSHKCLSIACCGILAGMVRRDPMRLFAEPVKKDVAEYHKVIKDPIDFSKIREKIVASEYSSLGAFVNDARQLCINACIFNAADTLYATTAKEIFDSLEIMADRAKKWIAMLKNAHSASFTKDSTLFTSDSVGSNKDDIFKDVRLVWPGAVELLEDSAWLNELAKSDFVRTKENEIAYYGALAIRRIAAAAEASILANSDLDLHRPVVKRSHLQDELLRRHVDQKVSLHTGSIQLSDIPNFREESLLTLLKRVQKRRAESRLSSESGCARCDGFNIEDEVNVSTFQLRRKFKRTIGATKPRVLPSRLAESTGLASWNAQEASKEGQLEIGAPLESIGQVMTENKVSVQGSRTHGWGLFCDKPFSKGEVVAEYIGEYVTDAVADRREKYYRKQRIQDYQFKVDKSLVIDATHKGGYARYINHSCNPNCVANIVKGKAPNEHLKRVIIVAQRDIKATEELSYDYQFPLEMNIDSRIPCNCGSRQCRGFMNWDIPEKGRK